MFRKAWAVLVEFTEEHTAAVGALPVLALAFAIGACNKGSLLTDDEIRKSNEEKVIDADIAKRGFTQVGTTPDGKPLFMTVINKGWLDDRVYFSDDSITAKENCGKNCTRSITSIRH